ncbi:hypothetical protein SprV_0200681200 [Sparganum proliferum]
MIDEVGSVTVVEGRITSLMQVVNPPNVNYLAPNSHFSHQLVQHLEELPAPDDNATVKTQWYHQRTTIRSTALDVLGCASRQHRDRLDDSGAEITDLLVEENCLHKAYTKHKTDAIKCAIMLSRRLVQKRLREVCGPRASGTAPLPSSDGTTLLTEKSQTAKRWAEYFRTVLYRPSTIFDVATDWFSQVETNTDMNRSPSLPETIKAVQQLFSEKTIPVDLYKHVGPLTKSQRSFRCSGENKSISTNARETVNSVTITKSNPLSPKSQKKSSCVPSSMVSMAI